MSSGALVDDGAPTPRGKWVSVGSEQFSTMAEGKDNLKMMEGGKWKWDKSPGDGRTQSCFRCNAHVDCDRVLRVHLVDGFFIIEGKGEHAPDPNLKRRLNSTLTFDMETRVRESMDQGGRSAGLAVALTNSKVKELKMSGKNPEHFKKPEGGLLGALKLCKSVRIQPDTPFGLVS